MATQYIPDEDELLRAVPYARLERDADDNIIGITAEAFRLRDGEEYLSANWVDFFKTPLRSDRVVAAIRSARKGERKIGAKSGFAITQTGRLKSAAARYGRSLRVSHEPEDLCPEHVAIRRYPKDCEELLELLAAEHWAELVLNSSVL